MPGTAGDRPLADLVAGLGGIVPIDEHGVADPFLDWTQESNGRVWVSAHERSDVGYLSVEGAPLPDGATRAVRVDASLGLQQLFSSAVAGGAYSAGRSGGEARRSAWKAVASVLGLSWPQDLTLLAERASAAAWVTLDPSCSEWFHQIAWDVWLLVADGSRVVVIAATDTD